MVLQVKYRSNRLYSTYIFVNYEKKLTPKPYQHRPNPRSRDGLRCWTFEGTYVLLHIPVHPPPRDEHGADVVWRDGGGEVQVDPGLAAEVEC